MSTLAMRRGIETYDEYVRRTDRLVIDGELLYADQNYGVAGGPGIVDWIQSVIRDWVSGLWESRDIDDRVRDINDENLKDLNIAADAVEDMAGEMNVTLVLVTRAETSLKGATAQFAKIAAQLKKAKAASDAEPGNDALKAKAATLTKQFMVHQGIVTRMTGLVNRMKANYNRSVATKDLASTRVLQADTAVQETAARGQEFVIEDQSAAVLERLNKITAMLGGLSIGSEEGKGKFKDSLDKVEITVARRKGKAEGRAELNEKLLAQKANDWLGSEVDLGEIDSMLADDSVLAEAQKALASKVTTEATK